MKKAKSIKKKTLKVTWKKQTKQVTGYEIQCSTSRNFKKNLKKVTVKGAKKTSVTVRKFKSNKKYFVRIRTYKTVKGKKYYSKWSRLKTGKVK